MSEKFAIASDGMDPNKVPKKKLNTGAEIPVVGLGTFGSDHVTGEEIARAVVGAGSSFGHGRNESAPSILCFSNNWSPLRAYDT